MSRCYPYPPPGYEKKAQVELGLSPKKEKHKHKHKDKDRDKDKKKKRRRDSETNGDVHDKDKRSNKIQRTELVDEVLGLENGRVPETKGATSAVAVQNRLQRIERVQAGSSKRDYDCATCESAVYIKDKETNGKIDSELPLILARSVRNSNGAVVSDLAPSPRQNPANDNEFNRQRHTQFIPQKEGVWSAVDDQEWLFLCNNQLRSKPKAEEGGTSLVWAEAVLLPCVDIYALPYVVPY